MENFAVFLSEKPASSISIYLKNVDLRLVSGTTLRGMLKLKKVDEWLTTIDRQLPKGNAWSIEECSFSSHVYI